MEEGTRSEDDQHWCLYIGTRWEAEFVADRRDVEEFKEASCTIGRVLSVRALVDLLRFLSRVFECRKDPMANGQDHYSTHDETSQP
jgi:hypothetical protein